MRPADGYMVDAKYVQDDGKECWRKPETLDNLEDTYKANGKNEWNREKFFKEKDDDELIDYRNAMKSHKDIRGLEIITNDQDSAAYWQTLMVEQKVKGSARYVP